MSHRNIYLNKVWVGSRKNSPLSLLAKMYLRMCVHLSYEFCMSLLQALEVATLEVAPAPRKKHEDQLL